MTQAEKDSLESLIDKHSLAEVLSALADICNEKAQHLSDNWQAVAEAYSWDKAAGQLDKTAAMATAHGV